MTPKLSVCITTYNRAALLDRTLQSLAAQTRLPDELIVSDDCSPDETPQVISKWQDKFPKFRYHRNPKNLYMPGNLNVAVSMARGEYIANLHDADEFDPTLLEKWESALDNYPTAGFVFCGVVAQKNEDGSARVVNLHDVTPFTPGRQFFEQHLMHKFASIVWGTVMARRVAYEQLLPFDTQFGFISDVDMWMRMCLNFDVAYVREPLIILDNSSTKERRFDWLRVDKMRRMNEANVARFYGGQPERLQQELRRHQWMAQRYYLRRLLGRVRHREWASLRQGFTVCRNLGLPLRLLGVLGA